MPRKTRTDQDLIDADLADLADDALEATPDPWDADEHEDVHSYGSWTSEA